MTEWAAINGIQSSHHNKEVTLAMLSFLKLGVVCNLNSKEQWSTRNVAQLIYLTYIRQLPIIRKASLFGNSTRWTDRYFLGVQSVIDTGKKSIKRQWDKCGTMGQMV